MLGSRLLLGRLGIRAISHKAHPRREGLTRFPTVFNPRKSANNPRIRLPPGLVYNPAPSAADPRETPQLFLPPLDPRTHIERPSEEMEVDNMPPLKTPYNKTYSLTATEIEQIRHLRAQDPTKWTRKALAQRFSCSPFFISMVSKPPREHLDEMNRRLELIKSRWRPHKANARYDRTQLKRRALRDTY